MATTRHRLADMGGALFIGGTITSLGVSGVNISSTTGLTPPLAQNADVSVVRDAIGEYTMTINPFRGPLGAVCHSVTASSTASYGLTTRTTTTYTNDSLAVTIKVASGAAFADGDISFMIFAF